MLIALAVVVVLLVALVGVALTKPDTLHVRRMATIKAPPDRIFALINDFHNWGAWSPWEKRDPALKRTYSGPSSGTGAVYAWDGNKNVGSGRMEITESSPFSRILIKLDFIKPFEGHNITEFTLEPAGDSTTVTWDMRGPSTFVTKVMQVFMNMDTMIGKDFETGLASIKAITEK
jgi:hypothetical protein